MEINYILSIHYIDMMVIQTVFLIDFKVDLLIFIFRVLNMKADVNLHKTSVWHVKDVTFQTFDLWPLPAAYVFCHFFPLFNVFTIPIIYII